jgi:hypothetical protein
MGIIQQFDRRQFAIENREKGKNQAKRKETGICKSKQGFSN